MIRLLREPINALTHWFGVLMAVVLTVLLCVFAFRGGVHWWPFLVYGISMILLYLASATLHSVRAREAVLEWLTKLDHSAIFLLIAGSYTPIAYFAMPPEWAKWTLIAVWGVAVAGVIMKLITLNLHRWLSTGIYLLMGWGSVLLVPYLFQTYSWGPVVWVAVGGIFYSIGAVIYGTKRFNPIPGVFGYHEIWHLFVLAGTASHATAMFYLIPSISA